MTNSEIIQKTNKYVMNTYGRFPMAPVKGRGSWLWDADGKKYLDFLSGIAVCNLGHSHPRILHSIAKQAKKLLHVSNLYHIDHQAELAQLLVENSCTDKVFFCNSGAEANEAAVKLARKYARKVLKQNRYEIITMNQSFHGRTLGMIAATGQEKVKIDFEPLLPGFNFAPFGDVEALRNAITPQTIAIMVEPIQGEGGVRVPPKDYFKSVKDLCMEKNLLLIFDEVQVGIGRTGKLFAYENYGVTPDIITLAKALGAGVPIGAMMARDFVAEAFEPGSHASTFGGNPLVTAVALESVKGVLDEGLANAASVSKTLEECFKSLKKEFTWIREVRGIGMIWGIELEREAKPYVFGCLKEGLLINMAGPKTLRLLPPLTVKEKEVKQAFEILKTVLHKVRV